MHLGALPIKGLLRRRLKFALPVIEGQWRKAWLGLEWHAGLAVHYSPASNHNYELEWHVTDNMSMFDLPCKCHILLLAHMMWLYIDCQLAPHEGCIPCILQ